MISGYVSTCSLVKGDNQINIQVNQFLKHKWGDGHTVKFS